MDDLSLLKMAGFSTTGVAIVFLAYRIFKGIVGKKLISSCCGRKMEIGIDVGHMTPTPQPMTENPLRVVVKD